MPWWWSWSYNDKDDDNDYDHKDGDDNRNNDDDDDDSHLLLGEHGKAGEYGHPENWANSHLSVLSSSNSFRHMDGGYIEDKGFMERRVPFVKLIRERGWLNAYPTLASSTAILEQGREEENAETSGIYSAQRLFASLSPTP